MKARLLLLGITLFYLLFSFNLANKRSLSVHFVDEEDHFVYADYLNRSFKLYQDLSSNHQPLVYLGSQAVQNIFQPNSLYLLVKQHRLSLWLYGALWGVWLTYRFGLKGLGATLGFELLKYGLLGNLWLMESLAVYPALYLWGLFLDHRQKLFKFEWPLIGLAAFLVFFNLVPLWPWLALMLVWLSLKNRTTTLKSAGTALLLTLTLFALVPPLDWWRETISYNLNYAIPALNQVAGLTDWLKILLFPFRALLVPNSLQTAFIALMTVAVTLFSGKRFLLIYPLLILTNTRVLEPTAAIYAGFHLLPFVGLLTFWFWHQLLTAPRWGKVVFGLGLVGLLFHPAMPYRQTTDPQYEYYVNFSNFDDLNFAVRQLADPGDRLAILTSESLIGWQTPTVPATRQIVYYAWQHDVPRLQQEYNQVFKGDNPPQFIYGGNEPNLVAGQYQPLLKDGQTTQLYVKISKLDSLDIKVKQNLLLRNFSLSEDE
jgi:hypothetical protein